MPSIFPIILNSTHAVAGDNSTYTYKFPRGAINLRNASIAVSTINIYYSWPNISDFYNNRKYRIIFPDGSPATFTEFDVELPNDSNMTIEDINKHLQAFFVSIGKYHINATTGAYLYYMEWKSNPITYSIDLVCYNIPTSKPNGYNEPPGGFSYPAQANQQPSVIILNNNFGKLIGFNQGVWFDHSSDYTPQMGVVSSIMVRCSLINNKFTNPNDIIYAFTSQGASYGNILQIQNNNLIFSKIDDGWYDHVTIIFTDQEYRRLNIKDTNLVIYLIVQIDDIS